MVNETLRITADWLAGTLLDAAAVNQGVNAKLALVPRDAGDPAPTAIAVVEDETRHPSVARKRVPSQTPGLTVRLMRDLEQEPVPATIYTDADAFEVGIAHVMRDVLTEDALRDGGYVIRAVVRSLRELAKNGNAAQRQRNDIAIVQLVGIRIVPTFEELEDVLVTAGVIARYKVRDLKPLG